MPCAYRVSDALSLRGAAGRGFRAPDFKELYLQFINDAAGYAVYGNRDLRPEHPTNLTAGADAGLDRKGEHREGAATPAKDSCPTRRWRGGWRRECAGR
ncbi:MAG: TonB-dependent receptor [Gemmatimonadales bacterium]|nr:TonB-dependent receptor [Gemmatimonadales bacterium]MBA3554245.1 TonB-dependent receptor [Gemmatimonadales bacterium]